MASEPKSEIAFDWRAITPDDSPKTPVDLVADPRSRDLSTPKLKEGDAAYDFELPVYDFSDGIRKDDGRELPPAGDS
jgi:hypothetical protein